MGLPWLIKENPDINWLNGTLEWRKHIPYIIEDNDRKEGGDFTNFYPNTRDFIINTMTVETYQEPDKLNVPTCLDILKIKIADHFDQIFRKKKTDVTPEKLIPEIYHQYLKLFNKKASERYPEPRIYDHEIHLKTKFKPFKQSPYSLNPKQMDIAKEFIDENLKKGYIVHLKSEMASPLYFVGKKDGSLRPCQDYRKLNEGTVKDAFPLPNIQDLLQDLQGMKFFTKLDVRWGYNNIQIRPEDRWKAAFFTPFGLYEPTVMFFRLCNSPATFQQMMNHILWVEINNKWCKVYMDDILIFVTTLEELRIRTLQVLEVLLKHDLYLKPEKCEFEKKEVDYLGYVISHDKIAMDPKKLAGISEWPAPKNVRQV